MYTLYYHPGHCSLGIHALLVELGQEYTLKNIQDEDVDLLAVNPSAEVPVLFDGDYKILEGAAQMIYLMEKHDSDLLPKSGKSRADALQWLMFANASIHGTYSKAVMARLRMENPEGIAEVIAVTTKKLNVLWKLVDDQLSKTEYVAGDNITAADFFLTVYTAWAGFIGLDITLGKNVERMTNAVRNRPSFQAAMRAEGLID